MEAAIRSKRLSSNFLGTSKYTLNSGFDSGTLLNCELVDFSMGSWERLIGCAEATQWQRVFSARFVKWH